MLKDKRMLAFSMFIKHATVRLLIDPGINDYDVGVET